MNFKNSKRKGIMLLVLCTLFPAWMTLAAKIGLPEYSAWMIFEFPCWQILETLEDKH